MINKFPFWECLKYPLGFTLMGRVAVDRGTAVEVDAGDRPGAYEDGWGYGKQLQHTNRETTFISCTRAEPFMLSAAEKRFFWLLSQGFTLCCSAASPTQKRILKQDKVNLV